MGGIAVNGLGRIGKLVLRILVDRGLGPEIRFVNDIVGTAEQHALWLEFDSVQGRWPHHIRSTEDAILIDDHKIKLCAERNPGDLDLAGLDLVIECTGVFKTREKLGPYFDSGVPKVLVSAPVKGDDALNLVYGVNHQTYDAVRHDLITAASCTTNCLAPVVKVMHETFGIRHGSMTTIHDVTNTQVMIDKPAKDSRRARSGLVNLIPTTTGSASAITVIFPELEGRLNGHAVRVPLLNASLTDCVFELERETDAAEINAALSAAADGPLKGILGFESRPLVSTDFTHDPRSAIVDGPSTMVINGTQAKLYVWYDNEWGYANRLADIAQMILAKG